MLINTFLFRFFNCSVANTIFYISILPFSTVRQAVLQYLLNVLSLRARNWGFKTSIECVHHYLPRQDKYKNISYQGLNFLFEKQSHKVYGFTIPVMGQVQLRFVPKEIRLSFILPPKPNL